MQERKNKHLKDQILVLAPSEGLVSSDTWLRCRKKLMANKTFQGGRKAKNTWLAGKVKCHDFISLLPEGYNTMIGEGGSTLSGGEKQRISIARAMLKNAPVVLLDEATASVDPENEVYLQQAISTLVKDKTLIVIAHRLSTIRDAEQLLVIDNGKLVQHGKHDELVLQEGIYQKYWNIRQNAKAWKVAQ